MDGGHCEPNISRQSTRFLGDGIGWHDSSAVKTLDLPNVAILAYYLGTAVGIILLVLTVHLLQRLSRLLEGTAFLVP